MGWIWFDFAISLSLTLDIVFTFCSRDKQTIEAVIDPSKAKRSYLKSWFIVDLVAALPF